MQHFSLLSHKLGPRPSLLAHAQRINQFSFITINLSAISYFSPMGTSKGLRIPLPARLLKPPPSCQGLTFPGAIRSSHLNSSPPHTAKSDTPQAISHVRSPQSSGQAGGFLKSLMTLQATLLNTNTLEPTHSWSPQKLTLKFIPYHKTIHCETGREF